MPALTLRPAPFDRVAVLRALPAGVLAAAGGAWLALFVAVLAGADLTVTAVVWVAVAGACACLGGLVAGSGGSAAHAGLLLAAAAAAALLATGAAQPARAPALRGADLAPRARAPHPAHATARRHHATSRVAKTEVPSRRSDDASPPLSGETSPPTTVVRAYYDALDAGQFERAWARLTPAVQARFGGFEHWRAGYATTLGHTVDAVETQPGGVVRVTLTATDRSPCGGTTTRQFAVTWRLNAGHATALSAVKLAGQDPAAAC